MSIWLRLNGYPASEVSPDGVSPVTWENWADGGSGKASWTLALSPRTQHQAVRVGALVEVMCGMMPVWTGMLPYADRTTGEFAAYGLFAASKQYLALDGSGASTRDLGVAIARAQSLGWPAKNPYGIGGVVLGDTSRPVTLQQLLLDYGKQTGQRVGVDGMGQLFARADPTEPAWIASPGAAAFGSTDEDRARTLVGRYLDSTSGVYTTTYAGLGLPEADVDLSDKGPLSLIQAGVILGGMLALGRGSAWTNGVELSSDQLTTIGGTPAFLPGVREGQLMRSFGFSYASSGLSLDTVIGTTRYTQGSRTIYVEPVGTSPSTFSDVIEAA